MNARSLWFPRLGLLAGILVLAACSDTDPTPPVTPPPLTPPADAPTALVHGMVGSPVYNALEPLLKLTVSDGSQRAADYDLLIVDGDTHTPEGVRDDPLVQEAIRAGMWVLGLDHGEDHKQVGLGYLLEAGTKGASPAYLVRKTRSAAGHPTSHMIEFRHEGPDAAQTRAAEIVRYLKEPELAAQQSITPPDNLLNATFTFTENGNFSMPGINTNTDPPGQPQTTNWTVSNTVKVFLQNGNNPQGDYQWVLVETTGSGNPEGLAVNKVDEIGWYQTRFYHELGFAPTSGNGNLPLTLLKTDPQNANNVETVTTNVGFSVGFNQAQGGLGSFSYSNLQTRTISDWKISNQSSQEAAATFFIASNNPVNGLDTDDSSGGKSGLEIDSSAFDDCYLGCTYLPVQPNNLSTATMQYFTQALWQTNNVILDEVVSFGGFQNVTYTDAWCYDYSDFGGGCGDREGDDNTRLSRSQQGFGLFAENFYTVNLGAVVPIPIKSLTFSPNPVVAGQTTTATLTLDKAAETDIILDISSASQFATPTQNKYTIPKGSDSIEFPVQTGPDGTGQDFSAKITAFYAEGQDAILTINVPGSDD